MATKVIFDGATYSITIKPGVTELDVKEDLYSAAKEDWRDEVNLLHKYFFPFIALGGNDLGGGQVAPTYYFLKSPWVIVTSGDGVLHNVALNLYAVEPDGVTPRDPFQIISGDSLSNKTSDIPGASLLGIVLSEVEWMKRWAQADEHILVTRYYREAIDNAEIMVDKSVVKSGDDIHLTEP